MFTFLFLIASAGAIGCDYLTGPDGRYHEGLQRPTIVIENGIAQVAVFKRTGFSAYTRVEYTLLQRNQEFADEAGNTLTYQEGGQAVLTLDGLRARCFR